jgi:ubiquinone/menaquinone biosynthesis C-methylase UbiE
MPKPLNLSPRWSPRSRRWWPRGPLHERSRRHELLDADSLDPAELAANLRDFARLNSLPGGVRTSVAAIDRLTGRASELTILDVGAGGGDMALRFAAEGRRRGGRWRVLAVEARAEIVELAERGAASDPDVILARGDARRLELPDDSVDVAHASLLVHHLDPSDARLALSEMARVARRGVVINDLRRGLLPLAMTATTVLALASSRYARHDGIVSALRAYRLDELDALLAEVGLGVAWRSSTLLPRVTTAAVPR